MKRALYLLLALAPAVPAGAQSRNPLDSVRLEELTATRERPLFAPTRRPPPPARVEAPLPPAPPPVEVKAAAIEPPPYDLVGAVVGEGAAFALLRNKATSQVVRMRPGDDAEGWRVGAIGLRSVALERDGRTESLALAAPSASTGATPVSQLAGEPQGDGAVAPPIVILKPAGRRAHDQ